MARRGFTRAYALSAVRAAAMRRHERERAARDVARSEAEAECSDCGGRPARMVNGRGERVVEIVHDDGCWLADRGEP